MEHQPATPLPWVCAPESADVITGDGDFIATAQWPSPGYERALSDERLDAIFIAHAANNYGPLVEALRGMIEDHDKGRGSQTIDYARSVLRASGEAE